MTILTDKPIPLQDVAKIGETLGKQYQASDKNITEYCEDGKEITWVPQHYRRISQQEWEMMGREGEPQYKVVYFPISDDWGCKELIDFEVEVPTETKVKL